MSQGLIILAEDDDKLRRLYADFLTANEYNVVVARDGIDVLGLLNKGHIPRVLILDVMMPKLDGIETCRRARELLGPNVPILFLTAADRLDKLQECMDAGGDDFLIKSDRLDEIQLRIKYWATFASRHDAQERRETARYEVGAAVVEHAGPVLERVELSSTTDDTVRQMSRLVKRARAAAEDRFGVTVQEKLYLLGYVTGVVDHWANIKLSMKSRFMDYLRAVLQETGTLSRPEVNKMIDNFDELAKDRIFRVAWMRGQKECDEASNKGPDFVATGLADFEEATAI